MAKNNSKALVGNMVIDPVFLEEVGAGLALQADADDVDARVTQGRCGGAQGGEIAHFCQQVQGQGRDQGVVGGFAAVLVNDAAAGGVDAHRAAIVMQFFLGEVSGEGLPDGAGAAAPREAEGLVGAPGDLVAFQDNGLGDRSSP